MYDNCPICESKLIEDSNQIACVNDCYTIVKHWNVAYEYIFDKKFTFHIEDHSDTWKKVEKELKEEIAYWRENDRYLIKIMVGDV